MIHYGVTKTADLALSRGLAKRMAGTGVTVNAILPGPTLSEGVSEMLADAVASGKSLEEAAPISSRHTDRPRSSSALPRSRKSPTCACTSPLHKRPRPPVRRYALTAVWWIRSPDFQFVLSRLGRAASTTNARVARHTARRVPFPELLVERGETESQTARKSTGAVEKCAAGGRSG
jgi:NAD(P)-dependent dehydrogenase (short-subunit alcohol dehydrogenase family)